MKKDVLALRREISKRMVKINNDKNKDFISKSNKKAKLIEKPIYFRTDIDEEYLNIEDIQLYVTKLKESIANKINGKNIIQEHIFIATNDYEGLSLHLDLTERRMETIKELNNRILMNFNSDEYVDFNDINIEFSETKVSISYEDIEETYVVTHPNFIERMEIKDKKEQLSFLESIRVNFLK